MASSWVALHAYSVPVLGFSGSSLSAQSMASSWVALHADSVPVLGSCGCSLSAHSMASSWVALHADSAPVLSSCGSSLSAQPYSHHNLRYFLQKQRCHGFSSLSSLSSHSWILFGNDPCEYGSCGSHGSGERGDCWRFKAFSTSFGAWIHFGNDPFDCASCRRNRAGKRGDCSRFKAFSTSLASSPPTLSTADTAAPSVTWGIIPQPPEAKETVFEYLRREGIDTSELADLELPQSVEVVQERLDFLRKIGLRTETINNYPLMVTCSVRKNLVPVLDYLEKLGITAKALPGLLEKYPMVLHSSVVIDLMPVIDYLQGLDIQKKDIPSVLLRFPDVLGFRLEGTMSTSVAFLVRIGVKTRSIGRMLTAYPEIMGMRVASTIKPKVDFLVSLGITEINVARLLETRPQMLGYNLNDTMRPAVDNLLKAGVKDEALAGMVTECPEILGQTLEKNLIEKSQWLVEQVKIAPCDASNIFEKLPQVLFIKESLAMGRISFFTNAGFSVDDVATMVTDCPQLLAMSIDQALEPSLTFLLQDMKRSIREAVDFPAYFTYSLKTIIQPRHKLISERGIKCSLEWFLDCKDQKFRQRLEAQYIDDEESEALE